MTDQYDERQEALEELVHEQASQIASNAINAGESVEFLLSNGWTNEDIESRLAEMTTHVGTYWTVLDCANGHRTEVEIHNPKVNADGTVDGYSGSAADFCAVCDSSEMTVIGAIHKP